MEVEARIDTREAIFLELYEDERQRVF